MNKCIVFILSLVIFGCGGESGGGSTSNAEEKPPVEEPKHQCIVDENCTDEQIEDIYNLPPNPSIEDDDLVIKGIDSDGNGIGDRAEHLITKAVPYNDELRALYLRDAAIWLEMVDNQNDLDKQNELQREIWLLSECKGRIGFSEDLRSLTTELKRSTEDRWELFARIKDEITFRPNVIEDHEYDTYCESYQ